ncbi:MAG TPA: aldehyde dehydrogenase family protein [Polyangia bacterium]|nr:aldehyde dehydrogenase family protein [Polyangia bacterium]
MAQQLDERRIQEIVEKVMQRLGGGNLPQSPLEAIDRAIVRAQPKAPAYGQPLPSEIRHKNVRVPQARLGIFPDVDSAAKAARKAFEQYDKTPIETRNKMIEAMRAVTLKHVRELSEYAHAETGLGRVDDKIKKNTLVATKTPGTEILRPISYSGDHGLAVIERAPFGVFGAITPTTNPTETICNNSIGMLAGGNAVVFNTHPSAWRVCGWHVHLLNEAIAAAGGPENLICSIAEPTIESAQALMKHPLVRILTVTGGPGVVKEAMNSGKRAIAAGPGNPPAVVDETAHLEVAARGIIDGASIDNNIICTAEKEVLVVSSVADRLKELLVQAGCYLMNDRQVKQLEGVILEGDHTNKKFVGKNASEILKQIGVHVGDDCRLAICEVPEQHPFVQHELLMPVIGIVRYPDVVSAIAGAKRVEHGFGHTAVMYGTNIDSLSAMARTINTSIFVKNGPNLNGLGYNGEGYTSFTIASPTGEGLTTAISFTRERRCTLKDHFRFV